MTREPRDGLDIWLVDLEAGETILHRLGEAHQLLAPVGVVETAAATSSAHVIRAAPGSRRQQAARLALRAVLAGYVGQDLARQPFEIGPAGKPRLPAGLAKPQLDFSLTHCETAALIAISSAGAVGIDIEASRPVRINPERRAMLEDAADALSPDEPLPAALDDRRFLQAWVRLEALAKATGEGISALLGRLGIRGRSLLVTNAGSPAGQPMRVRDLRLDAQPPLHAAIAGVLPLLGAGIPAPPVRTLPLDAAFLEALVTGPALAWPRAPPAPAG